MRVKLVYEGHQVKVKVTGAKKLEIPYFQNVEDRTVKFACSMGFSAMADRKYVIT